MDEEKYYHIAREASNKDHPGILRIAQICQPARMVLEIGCGEGTKLFKVLGENAQGYGIDVSPKAIEIAQKQYPNFKFSVADAATLPFDDNYFDVSFSAFSIEHIEHIEEALREMIRVTKKNGFICILAPNYGSPNRASPPLSGSRIKKLFSGFLDDLFSLANKQNQLNWCKVTPNKNYHQVDDDTVTEPYLRSLKDFLTSRGLIIQGINSFWGLDEKESVLQKIFHALANVKIYPFYYWGPHLYICAKKR